MPPILPAIVVGGPPHSGKSVLIHALTRALRRASIAHYVLRANPDGEGDWANEAEQMLVQELREKGNYSERFIERAVYDLRKRPLPFVVDVGGKPRVWQEVVFDHCTHGVLLISDKQIEIRVWWQNLYARRHVDPIADLTSTLCGMDELESADSVLIATISGLERGAEIKSDVLDQLVTAIRPVFRWSDAQAAAHHLANAPLQPAYDVLELGKQIGVVNNRWEPSHLSLLAQLVEADRPCALYGRGPVWLYGCLAARATAFWQFDARRGWVQPPSLVQSGAVSGGAWREEKICSDAYTVHAFLTASEYLSIRNPKEFPVHQQVNSEKGIVISGKLPLWLSAALVRLYRRDCPWVACYQPQVGAVVVATKMPDVRPIGSVIAVPELDEGAKKAVAV